MSNKVQKESKVKVKAESPGNAKYILRLFVTGILPNSARAIKNINVSNSIKHTPEGGKITVSGRRNEDKIIVEVKDTGIGMSKPIKDKLFTPQMVSFQMQGKKIKEPASDYYL